MPKKRRSTPPPQTAADVTAEALARYRPLLGEDEFAQLVAELERPLYTAIRINPLKVDPQPALSGWIERYGWTVQPVPYCEHGYWITAARVSPSQTIEHRLGYYYIQDAASMLPVELFDFSGHDAPLMLDMAASPGGKTTHMIARSGDRGLVIANDSSPSRINALRLVLEQWGAVSPAVTRFPGENFGSWFPDTFDRVLLDAPCSMQNLRSTEAHPMRPISDKERGALAVARPTCWKARCRP
jgi:16S rRNA (cytosine1407-C5)-methyltransferase